MTARAANSPVLRVTDNGPVLWDEDYRQYIWALHETIDRERALVWQLQQELAAERRKRK